MYAIILSTNEIFRKGIRYTLSHGCSKLLTEEHTTAEGFAEKVAQYQPNMVVVDLEGKEIDGLSLVKSLRQNHPRMKVVTFSSEHQKNAIFPLLELGVEGYLFKDSSGEEIVKAVTSVMGGTNYYDQRVVAVMHQRITNQQGVATLNAALTQREQEILRLICQEHTNKEIGGILNISRRTVDGHRTRLMKKCGAKNTAGLIYYAIEQGFAVRQQRSA